MEGTFPLSSHHLVGIESIAPTNPSTSTPSATSKTSTTISTSTAISTSKASASTETTSSTTSETSTVAFLETSASTTLAKVGLLHVDEGRGELVRLTGDHVLANLQDQFLWDRRRYW
ncbi:hypothetical protein M8J77_013150 [Diaphorina citri]|nr:hypothetical protein M8J77_013150 [Diaphorina citri]